MAEIVYNVKIRIPREILDADGIPDPTHDAEALAESMARHLMGSGYKPPRRRFNDHSVTLTFSGVDLTEDPRKGISNLTNFVYAIVERATVTISPYIKPRRRISPKQEKRRMKRDLERQMRERFGDSYIPPQSLKDLKGRGIID